MKHYFLVYTADNEYGSSIKHIAETKELAEKFLFADKSGWYSPQGSGQITEVDCNMNRIREWGYHAKKCNDYFDRTTHEWKYLNQITGKWVDHIS